MIDIVKAYKDLEDRFYRSRPDANGDISIEDGVAYMKQQEEFVRVAREYYSDGTLDYAEALQRFRNDLVAQEVLEKSEEKGKHR